MTTVDPRIDGGPPAHGRAESRRSPAPDAPDGHAVLSVEDGRFLRRGVPHRILAGSVHYFRVHPAYWYDRLARLQDMGLNTIDTVVPWNFHQSAPGGPVDFSGLRDLPAFLETAATVGLDVLLRPGPYVCAEWTNGGLPVWLTAGGATLRSSDPTYQQAVAQWFDVLLPRLATYQSAHGGPIVAVQVENEFGSYGDDAGHLRWLVDELRRRGVTELLYTSDGPTDLMVDGGSIEDVLVALNFGSRPAGARELLGRRRPGQPFFCAEFWNGWFDHWGTEHHVRDAGNAAQVVADIVADGGSVSLYMAHGGTNFGLWAGANEVEGRVVGTITSYDSDAPVAEDGRLTEKFFALREVLTGRSPAEPVRSSEPRFLPPSVVPLQRGAGLETVLDHLARSARPTAPGLPTFDSLGFDGGLARYRAAVVLPPTDSTLHLEAVDDVATVSVDGQIIGRVTGSGSLPVVGTGRQVDLTVLVESLGRVNYGPHLGRPKGLTGPVLVDRRLVQLWSVDTVDLPAVSAADLTELCRTDSRHPSAPTDSGLVWADVHVEEPLDTHLALPGFGRAYVWVNGFLIGRYRSTGPQETLYVPGPLLRRGDNRVVVVDLDRCGAAVELTDTARLGSPREYVETF